MRLALALFALLLVAPLAPVARAADASVTVASFSFSPASVTIPAGGSVLWTWSGGPHTVTFDAAGGPADCPSASTGATCERTFPTPGTYSYHCAIHPSMTGTVVVQAPAATTPAPAANQPPVAEFNLTVAALNATVNASASSDPDGRIVEYAWDWGDGDNASGVSAAHSYRAPGDYAVTLRVTDDAGATATATHVAQTSRPPNKPPVALFDVAVSNLTVDVNGTASYDPDGTLQASYYEWGDGQSSPGATAALLGQPQIGSDLVSTHTYGAAGQYVIVLHVEDDRGGQANVSHSVNVSVPPGVVPPVATFRATVADGMKVLVDASNTTGWNLTGYAWRWDPSAGADETTTPNATHVYSTPGRHTIQLTVTDGYGQTSTAFQNVTLASRPPTPSMTLSVSGLEVTGDAFGSAGEGRIVSYSWDWGDGSSSLGPTASHRYASPGPHEVRLTVTDAYGISNATTQEVDAEAVVAAPTPAASNVTTTSPPAATSPAEKRAPGLGLVAALAVVLTLARGRSGRW